MQNLTVLAFDNLTQAFELRDALLRLEGHALFELADIAVLTRDSSGKTELHQQSGIVSGCASAGSVAGLILGALVALPWAGSAIGAGVGALVGALTRYGIDAGFMRELALTLTPGTSALVILGSKAKLDELGTHVGPLLKKCTILRTEVDPEQEQGIRQLLARYNPANSDVSPSNHRSHE